MTVALTMWRRTSLVLAALSLQTGVLSAPGHAQSEVAATDQMAPASKPAHIEITAGGVAGPARIYVGRALDLEGGTVYPGRTAFSGTAGVAVFSTTRPVVARWAATGSMTSAMPVYRAALTSGFGFRAHPILGRLRMHSGVDLAAPTGTPILATSDGLVESAGWSGGYGNLVQLQHRGGLETRYGHMSQVAVIPGQAVRKGEVIGYVGSTGMSTGPHLHYEMRLNGVAVRPSLR